MAALPPSDPAPAPDEPFDLRPPTPLDRLRALLGPPHDYRFTRFLILRLLGLVYFFAFLGLARQVIPLIGADGLTPARDFVAVAGEYGLGPWRLPSIFWIGCSDGLLQGLAWVGVALSLLVLVGFANLPLLLLLWALYMSFANIGQDWYGYGWEIQLLETGFLAAFLAPPLDPRPFPARPPPVAVIWMYRWLLFRIMLGAGLIKWRGDPCWRELTCLDYHFETQPVPNPLSPYFHAAPHAVHVAGVLFNHLCELLLPWLVFGPRRARHVAGALMLAFQLSLIASGNLAFLNWLTIIPVLACFDDGLSSRLMPRRLRDRLAAAPRLDRPARGQRIAVGVLAAIVVLLSIDPVRNLLSRRQQMNRSFDPLALVNTYGAFGSVGRERYELVIEGSSDDVVGPATVWRAYELPCKPGDPRRRPCILGPYHDRLDWQIWFAAMGSPASEPWIIHLVWKLLHGDPGALSLLANDPFPDAPPRHVRILYYRYRMTPPGDGAWWQRELVGEWLPPVAVDDPALAEFLADHGWR